MIDDVLTDVWAYLPVSHEHHNLLVLLGLLQRNACGMQCFDQWSTASTRDRADFPGMHSFDTFAVLENSAGRIRIASAGRTRKDRERRIDATYLLQAVKHAQGRANSEIAVLVAHASAHVEKKMDCRIGHVAFSLRAKHACISNNESRQSG